MAEGIIDLTNANFNSTISQKGVTLVDFWAPWCGPCRMLSPVLAKVATALEGKAVIAKVNVDENQELAAQFQVTSIPTMFIFKDGQVVKQLMGLKSEAEITKAIEAAGQ
ncbi:MAG: thioredoxin [Limisphaerales bacterium]|jgi:thioredoxin 1|nr:thioredoxin [Verrucomicrobiota bacterium]